MKFDVEWPVPKNNDERLQYALTCFRELQFPTDITLTVDDVTTNAFNKAFRSWPTCHYVVDEHGKLLYILECDELEASYDINDLFKFVEGLYDAMEA